MGTVAPTKYQDMGDPVGNPWRVWGVRAAMSLVRGVAMQPLFSAVMFWTVLATSPALGQETRAWGSVLHAHAHRGGVDYGALVADRESMARLNRFVESLATMPPEAGLADWINAYNGLVVWQVTQAYRRPNGEVLGSVMEVPGFFKHTRFQVAGQARTLDEIEHRMIRPRFQDARVHAALNCGAVSCPALLGQPLRAQTLEHTLKRLAQRMVARPVHVRIRDGVLQVSALFDWFGDDFRNEAATVLGWIQKYDTKGTYSGLPADTRITYQRYNWRLNDRARAP